MQKGALDVGVLLGFPAESRSVLVFTITDMNSCDYTKEEVKRIEDGVRHQVISYLNSVVRHGEVFPKDPSLSVRIIKVDQGDKLLAAYFEWLRLQITTVTATSDSL